MTTVASAEQLPRLDLYDPEVARALYAQYKDARTRGRVAYSERFGGYYMLTRYEDVKAALSRHDLFSTTQGVTVPSFGLPLPSVPLEVDPPDHAGFRRVLMPLFRPAQVKALGTFIEDLTTELIDEFIEAGRADLKADLCNVVPSRVIEKLLGLEPGEWTTLRGFGMKLRETSRAGQIEENAATGHSMAYFVEELLDRKRKSPQEDLLTLLLTAQANGRPLSHAEMVGMALMVGNAGISTTVSALSSTFTHLGLDRSLRTRLMEEPGRIPVAIDEMLRFDSPIQMFVRTVTVPCEFAGHPFKPGDRVGMLFGAANHDADVFPRCDSVDIDRRPNPHLAFGAGVHRCVAEPLARLEMQIVIGQVLLRLPDYELAAAEWQPGYAREVASLPVTFTPGRRLRTR